MVHGDSLAILKSLPNNSVSLVLTDPPYHSTKKRNVYGDSSFEKDTDFVDWMSCYADQWRRVLKPNGSLFCFCSSKMVARLELTFGTQFNILSQIVWTKPNEPGFDGWKGKMRKEALRTWYPHSERIIFAEPALDGNLRRSPLGVQLREARIRCGLTTIELAERIGAYGKVNHGGAVANWEAGRNIPSEEQYRKLRAALISRNDSIDLPLYRDAVRPFNVGKEKAFTDVWDFPSVRAYKGKHPAEKPIALLEHAISATTYERDIVLDCFSGSGSTIVAALRANRHAIGIEIDPTWFNSSLATVRHYVCGELAQRNGSPPPKSEQSSGEVEGSLF